MAKPIDYDDKWDKALDEACMGDHMGYLHKMDPMQYKNALKEAFRHYLLECYCEHVRSEFGPALAPVEDIGLLQLKAALVNQWKTTDVPSADKKGIIDALTGELSTFKLPQKAYEAVSHLEQGASKGAFGGAYKTDFIAEMVKHHRPASLEPRQDHS